MRGIVVLRLQTNSKDSIADCRLGRCPPCDFLQERGPLAGSAQGSLMVTLRQLVLMCTKLPNGAPISKVLAWWEYLLLSHHDVLLWARGWSLALNATAGWQSIRFLLGRVLSEDSYIVLIIKGSRLFAFGGKPCAVGKSNE